MTLTAHVRRRLAPSAKAVLHRLGAYAILRQVRPHRGLAILRYHAVCGPSGHAYADPSICVTPESFARQVAYLTANYRVVSLPEAVMRLRDGRPLPRNAVAFTFDDGYADNLYAARVLHRHGATATFYLTTSSIGGEQPFWLTEIRQVAMALSRRVLTLEWRGERIVLAGSSAPERQTTIRRLSRLLKSMPIPEREALRAQLRERANLTEAVNPMLSWDEVREMARLGMTIGAHTMTHANLPSAGLDDAQREIAGSRARVEAELGTSATMFSYPNGGAESYFDAAIRQLVVEAGFEAATTSQNGFAGPSSDPFALKRIQVSERLQDLVFSLEVERFVLAPRPR